MWNNKECELKLISDLSTSQFSHEKCQLLARVSLDSLKRSFNSSLHWNEMDTCVQASCDSK